MHLTYLTFYNLLFYSDNVSYPSSYPTVISVGATDARNSRSIYSNYGTGLDIMAPGGDTGVDRGTFGFLKGCGIHFDMFFLSQSLSTKTDGDGYVDGVLQETMSGGSVAYRFYQGTSMVRQILRTCDPLTSKRLLHD